MTEPPEAPHAQTAVPLVCAGATRRSETSGLPTCVSSSGIIGCHRVLRGRDEEERDQRLADLET